MSDQNEIKELLTEQNKILREQRNLSQMILVQLYRTYDVLAVDAKFRKFDGTAKELADHEETLNYILDLHESGDIPEIAKTDMNMGEEDG